MPKNVIKGAVKGSREPAPNILGIFLTNLCDKGVSPVGDKKKEEKNEKKKEEKGKEIWKLPAVERHQRRATQRQDILWILYVSKIFTLSVLVAFHRRNVINVKYQVIYFIAGETIFTIQVSNFHSFA